MKARYIVFAAAAAASHVMCAADFKPADVLVYTRWDHVKNQKTGEVKKGGFDAKTRPYHHESTEQGAEEVRRYFTANGYSCLVTDDPAVFVSDAMKTFKLVMLCNTNHELFDTAAQREAFYRFVENGGGLLATHCASANERGSKRFRDFLGGAFERHYAARQKIPFSNADRSHPAMACMDKDYVWADDEVYLNHPDGNVRPVLTLMWKDVLRKSKKTDKYGCPAGMTAVSYTDPATGHGVEFKMLAPLPSERIYTWSDHRYVNPMPIYEAPLDMKPGDSFALDYEVSVF